MGNLVITKYLNEINEKIYELKKETDCNIFVYRGELEEYDFPGMPGIFRGDYYKNFVNNISYEKSILDEFKSNRLTDSNEYLEIAMDAQHGSFPTRLLDVTFDVLIALLFSTTPYFKSSEDSGDEKDGVVIVYAINKMYNSNSDCIKKRYKEILENKNLRGEENSHTSYLKYLVDYSEINERIKAQKGAFILFDGDYFNSIFSWKQKKIIINKEDKKKLRQELEQLFNLNIGTVYPFSDILKDSIMKKIPIIRQQSIDEEEIFDEILNEFEYEKVNILNGMKKIEFNDKCDKEILKFLRKIKDLRNIIEDKKNNKNKDIDYSKYKKRLDDIDREMREKEKNRQKRGKV